MSISGPAKATARKRGRRAEHYTTSWDEPIYGLARRPSDGRWRIIGTDVTFTESDERLAVHRFKTWKARQERETIAVPFAAAATPQALSEVLQGLPRPTRPTDPAVALHESMVPAPTGGATPVRLQAVPGSTLIEFHREPVASDAFWPWLRRLILDKSALVTERTGIPELAYFADLPKPQPSPTLSEVGEAYFTKANVTPNERSKSRLFWNDFVAAVGVATLREITPAVVGVYLERVLGADQSPTYARHRFGKVKTILHHARKRGMCPDDVRRALDACAILVPPRPKAVDPHPIDRDDFHKLLGSADDQGTAMLLLSLNACLYGSEMGAVEWQHLDLDRGVMIAERGKTGVSRVACLWPRTVEALRKLPRRIASPFITAQGTPYNSNTANKWFRSLREAAKLCDDVKFADVRDGAYTAAAEAKGVQFEHARILAGHRTGMSDHYVRRRPTIVAEACAAIERAYFD